MIEFFRKPIVMISTLAILAGIIYVGNRIFNDTYVYKTVQTYDSSKLSKNRLNNKDIQGRDGEFYAENYNAVFDENGTPYIANQLLNFIPDSIEVDNKKVEIKTYVESLIIVIENDSVQVSDPSAPEIFLQQNQRQSDNAQLEQRSATSPPEPGTCQAMLQEMASISVCNGYIVRWILSLDDCDVTAEQFASVINDIKRKVKQKADVDGSLNYLTPLTIFACDAPPTFTPELPNPTASVADTNLLTIAVLDTGWDYAYTNHTNAPAILWYNDDIVRRHFNINDFDAFQKHMNLLDIFDNKFPIDTNGHGTAVTGLIVEKLYEYGLTKDDFRILPIQTHDQFGVANLFDIACGLCFAYDVGADIANASWGLEILDLDSIPFMDSILTLVTTGEIDKGKKPMKIIASAGHVDSLGKNNGATYYPAFRGYSIDQTDTNVGNPNVIPVTSINKKHYFFGDYTISCFANHTHKNYAACGFSWLLRPTYADCHPVWVLGNNQSPVWNNARVWSIGVSYAVPQVAAYVGKLYHDNNSHHLMTLPLGGYSGTITAAQAPLNPVIYYPHN